MNAPYSQTEAIGGGGKNKNSDLAGYGGDCTDGHEMGEMEMTSVTGATSELASPPSSASGGLGSLHCFVKYDFDKTALVVTIASCQDLPAKDAAAKSRYRFRILPYLRYFPTQRLLLSVSRARRCYNGSALAPSSLHCVVESVVRCYNDVQHRF